MAFCNNCGSPINDGAKFCSVCGKATAAYTGERRQIYDGVIHKCPNCGEVLDSLLTICPACGYELRDTMASQSIRDFASKIEQIERTRISSPDGTLTKTDEQIISLINSFAVPNTKEDLFEFTVLSSTNIDVSLLDDRIPDNNAKKAICKAWKAKLNQVYQKSIMVFDENDERFKKIERLYDQTQVKIQTKEKQQKRRYTVGLLLSAIGTIAALLLFAVGSIIGLVGDSGMDSSRASTIIIVGGIILIVAAILSGKKEDNIFAPVVAICGCILSIIWAVILPMLSNDSMDSSRSAGILITAAIALVIAIVNIIRLLSGNKKRNSK